MGWGAFNNTGGVRRCHLELYHRPHVPGGVWSGTGHRVAASPGWAGPTARVTWPGTRKWLALPGYCGHCGQQNMSTLQLLKHNGQVWLAVTWDNAMGHGTVPSLHAISYLAFEMSFTQLFIPVHEATLALP